MAASALALVGALSSAQAADIQYELTPGIGSAWTYSYTIVNPLTSPGPLTDFMVYFPEVSYSGSAPEYTVLKVSSAPNGWGSLVVPFDLVLALNETVEFSTSGSGISQGGTLKGFSIDFNYSGSGTPGAQYFELYNPNDYSLLDSGLTVAVPEPGTVLTGVATLGVLCLSAIRRRLKQ